MPSVPAMTWSSSPPHSENGRRVRSEEKTDQPARRARARLICGYGCFCCGPENPLWVRKVEAAPEDCLPCAEVVEGSTQLTLAERCATADGSRDSPYVDTHIHLEMVLQKVRWYEVAQSFSLPWERLSDTEQRCWKVLGFTAAKWEQPGGAVAGVAGSNKTWFKPWKSISEAQRQAAQALGWTASKWDGYEWLLPQNLLWSDLEDVTRGHLLILGETSSSWDQMFGSRKPAGFCDGGDMRRWDELSFTEQQAAAELGFTIPTWNMEELADINQYISDFCGPGFQGAVCQGCDADSIDDSVMLALAHPLVFAAFGCHPKYSWLYARDRLEERFLAAFDMCGKKAIAWGEFGLDFSNERYWDDIDYRNNQCEVFVRQLKLALERQLPMVFHIREAADESLSILQKYVPRHWKAHVHAFHGSSEFVEAILAEFPNFYFGLTGTISMGVQGDGARMAKLVPLERMLLETDGPYLLPRGTPLNHVGQIPLVARLVAQARNCSAEEVLAKSRENTRYVYGI